MNYTGRFAPTPSGPLHFGSICTALGSFLDARHQGGQWLLRIDDLDKPRVKAGATELILATIVQLGMRWDRDIIYQSQQLTSYARALDNLKQLGLTYPCTCTRAETSGKPYPGTCRNKNYRQVTGRYAIRVCIRPGQLQLQDRLQGIITGNIHESTGDIIVRRADDLFAYHLASVVNDAAAGVTAIVRGGDLIDASLCQGYLQKCLGLSSPDYCHLPLAVRPDGRKISKSTEREDQLMHSAPNDILHQALSFLGQINAGQRVGRNVGESMEWAISNWDLSRVPKLPHIVVSS